MQTTQSKERGERLAAILGSPMPTYEVVEDDGWRLQYRAVTREQYEALCDEYRTPALPDAAIFACDEYGPEFLLWHTTGTALYLAKARHQGAVEQGQQPVPAWLLYNGTDEVAVALDTADEATVIAAADAE